MRTWLVRVFNAIFSRDAGTSSESEASEPTIDSDLRRTSWFLGWLAVGGVIAVMAWAYTRGAEIWISASALGLLLLGGMALVGGVFGLLFGIPKSVSDPVAAAPSSANAGVAGKEGASTASRSSYAVNTNLEQISDWLTKIIVGVGLVEIGPIRTQFQELANYFGQGFVSSSPSAAAAPVVAAVIIVYGLAAGFLAGYLLTRMFLPGAFIRADRALRERDKLVVQIAEERKSTETAGRMQGEIYNDLYREGGFRDAIRKIDGLLSSPANQRNPALWVYLAAAHGQAWRWEHDRDPKSDPEKDPLKYHRSQALEAVRKALALGDDWKPILQLMWDKNHPVKKDGVGKDENDLDVFYDDKAFRDLLGS